MKSIFFFSAIFLSLTFSNLFSQSWSSTGIGVQNFTQDYTCVYSMVEFNNELYIGGCFTSVNGVPATYVAKFNGTNWNAVGNGLWHTGNNTVMYSGVRTMAVFNGELYAGGIINQSGTTPIFQVAKWDGIAWSPVGGFYGGADGVLSLCVFNNELYAGGHLNGYNSIAKWDGTSWIALGTGMQDSIGNLGLVRDMRVFNSLLYVGGEFSSGDGVFSENLIAWDGGNFISIGSGANGIYGVTKMGLYNHELVVAGGYIDINGIPLNNIASYNTITWSPFSTGTGTPGGYSFETQPIQEFNGKMFVGGFMSIAGSASVNNIAQWDGNSWQSVGTGTNGYVGSLATYQGALYAAGKFTSAGGVSVNNIAKWSEPLATVLGIHSNNAFMIYPNPFSFQSTLQLETPLNNAIITIENYLGLAVKTMQHVSGNPISLPRADLKPGIYNLHISESNVSILSAKLIIAD